MVFSALSVLTDVNPSRATPHETQEAQAAPRQRPRGLHCRCNTKLHISALVFGRFFGSRSPACPGCRRPTVRTPSPPWMPRDPGRLDRPFLDAWALAEHMSHFQHTCDAYHAIVRWPTNVATQRCARSLTTHTPKTPQQSVHSVEFLTLGRDFTGSANWTNERRAR